MSPVDIKSMIAKNENLMNGLIQRTLKEIYATFKAYKNKVDLSYVAFSGRKRFNGNARFGSAGVAPFTKRGRHLSKSRRLSPTVAVVPFLTSKILRRWLLSVGVKRKARNVLPMTIFP